MILRKKTINKKVQIV